MARKKFIIKSGGSRVVNKDGKVIKETKPTKKRLRKRAAKKLDTKVKGKDDVS